MKERLIEQKARRYDEAIERAKEINREHSKKGFKSSDDILYIFPELKESEDERIRKEMISFFEGFYDNKMVKAVDVEPWIIWLKKTKLKFKIGDNITRKDCNMYPRLVIETHDHYYTLRRSEDCTIEKLYYKDQELWKLVEQKPTDKDEPKFKVGDYIICRNGEDALYQITDSISTGYMIKGDDGIIHSVTFEQLDGCNATLCVIQNQKPAWSEDDEGMLYGVIETELYMLDVVNGIKEFDVGNDDIRKACTKELDWLKSLKDRVLPQPKQEWNGSDDAHIHSIITHLEDFIESHPNTAGADIQSENVSWLKSIRPQSHWRPTEEQIKKELDKAANEWEYKASFSPIAMVMDGDRPIGTKQYITSHADSFKAGVDWITKKLKG